MPNTSYISTIGTPDGSSYSIRPTLESLATIGITPGGNILNSTSDSSAASTTKILNIDNAETAEGLIIIVFPEYTNSATSINIALNGTSREYPVKYMGSTTLNSTTAGYVWNSNFPSMFIFYDSYWVFSGHGADYNTTYNLNCSYDGGPTICGSGTYPVSKYSLIMEKPDGTWEKITATNATQSTATTKTVNTSRFLLNHIKYYAGSNITSAGATLAANTCYSKIASVDMRYSTNCGASTEWHVAQYLYLVGTIERDGYFYLDPTCWWTVNLPNTADGKLYIQIGSVLSTEGTTISFLDLRPVLYYDADLGGIQLYGGTSSSSGDYLPLAGGTMSGAIDMGSNAIKHLGAGYGDDDAVRRDQALLYDPRSGVYTAKSLRIADVDYPVNAQDAVCLKYVTDYVDTAVAPKFNDTDVSIGNINGQNDFNIAYTYYDARSYQVLAFGGGLMSINTVCHIFVYYCGAAQNPGTYSGNGYFGIPNDIIVGNHTSGNKNHVWINGKKVNGGSISGSGNVTYFQTPSPGGIVEISVAYNKFGLQYRTFIKVDAPEASI